MIAIFLASSYEFDAAKKYYEIEKIEKYVFGKYFLKTINNKNIMFFKIGVGKTESSASTQWIIDKFNPKKIIVVGTCASTSNKFKLFDIVFPNETCEYDLSYENIGYYGTDIEIKDNVKTGCIGTSDIPLTNKDDSLKLKKENIDFVDMESAPIAKVSELNNINYLIIKGISDEPFLNENSKNYDWDKFQKNASIIINKILDKELEKYIEK